MSDTTSSRLFENLLVATPGGIEAQEKRGQLQQAKKQTLPIDGLDKNRSALESFGFKIGEPSDDLFCSCEFPKGWSKQPTDHAMWSNLLDEKGRIRGSIFYKAAFYDTSAHLRLNTRYSYDANYDTPEVNGKRSCCVKDSSNIIFSTEPSAYPHSKEMAECEAFLKQNYPDWQNITAYWE